MAAGAGSPDCTAWKTARLLGWKMASKLARKQVVLLWALALAIAIAGSAAQRVGWTQARVRAWRKRGILHQR